MKRLRLYQRAGCHLCEEMLEQLQAFSPGGVCFELEQVDVDGNEALRARYHERVPVLTGADGVTLCEVFFDPVAVSNYLQKA